MLYTYVVYRTNIFYNSQYLYIIIIQFIIIWTLSIEISEQTHPGIKQNVNDPTLLYRPNLLYLYRNVNVANVVTHNIIIIGTTIIIIIIGIAGCVGIIPQFITLIQHTYSLLFYLEFCIIYNIIYLYLYTWIL